MTMTMTMTYLYTETRRHRGYFDDDDNDDDDLFIEHRIHEMTQKINSLNDRRWCSAPYVSGRVMPLES